MDVSSVGAAALAEMADGCNGRVVLSLAPADQESESPAAAPPAARQGTPPAVELEPRHLHAIERLLEGERAADAIASLTAGVTASFATAGASGSAKVRLNWADVQATRHYESAFLRLVAHGYIRLYPATYGHLLLRLVTLLPLPVIGGASLREPLSAADQGAHLPAAPPLQLLRRAFVLRLLPTSAAAATASARARTPLQP